MSSSTGLRRALIALILASGCALVFATRTFTAFDGVRVKVVRTPTVPASGEVRLHVSDPRLAGLDPPFAVIGEVSNVDHARQQFALSIDGVRICEFSVGPAARGPLYCAASDPGLRRAAHEIVLATSSPAWRIESLELATHRGRSTGLLEMVILPAASGHYASPPVLWTPLVWLLLVGLLLVPRSRLPVAPVRYLHRMFAVATATLFTIAFVASFISPYRIVISVRTFVVWGLLAILPWSWGYLIRWGRERPGGVVALAMAASVRVGRVVWTTPPRRDRRLVSLLAVTLMMLAVVHGRTAIGGADEYGYVSEAELWLKGDLKIDQSFAVEAPWDRAAWSFAPLGYRPDPVDERLLVPVYSPGLPILLAIAKAIAGQTAMFFVVPLFAGLLVLSTYGVGCRLESSSVGLIGAWLVATSPVVISFSMTPMTDVPVAAVWTAAIYFVLGASLRSAVFAGFVAGLAILIRPNLVPLAGVLALYYVVDFVRGSDRRRALFSAAAFGAALLPGPIAVAAINNYLYGSPLTSGYGPLEQLFSWANVTTNLRLYLGWLVEAHTPFVLLGLAALFIPIRRIWPRQRRIIPVMATFVATVWAIYAAWLVFDAWWFCRLLLSSWPLIMLGVGAVAMALAKTGRMMAPLVAASVVAIGLFQFQFARHHGAFPGRAAGSRYWVVDRMVRTVTEDNSVVLALTHSGSIRYYAGRMTMNFSNFPGGLDDIANWLAAHHVHVYAALEDWELPEFKKRFDGAECLAALNHPIAVFEEPGKFEVFDLSNPDRVEKPIVVTGLTAQWSAPRPEPPPHLVLK